MSNVRLLHRRTSGGHRGFSILELLVVLVVVAVIAAIAIPTFQAIINRAQDRVVLVTAQAALRDASALAAMRGEGTFVDDDLQGVVDELGASAPVVSAVSVGPTAAAPQWTLTLDPDEYSNAYGVISGGFNADASAAALALRTPTGNCAFTRSYVGSQIEAWVSTTDLGADCTAAAAFTGGDGGPGPMPPRPGSDPGPVGPPTITSVDFPDPDDPVVTITPPPSTPAVLTCVPTVAIDGTTVTVPVPSGASSATIPSVSLGETYSCAITPDGGVAGPSYSVVAGTSPACAAGLGGSIAGPEVPNVTVDSKTTFVLPHGAKLTNVRTDTEFQRSNPFGFVNANAFYGLYSDRGATMLMPTLPDYYNNPFDDGFGWQFNSDSGANTSFVSINNQGVSSAPSGPREVTLRTWALWDKSSDWAAVPPPVYSMSVLFVFSCS